MAKSEHTKIVLAGSWRERLLDTWAGTLSHGIARFGELDPGAQRRAAVLLDTALCIAATWIAFALRLGIVAIPTVPFLIVLCSSVASWAVVSGHLGFYTSLLRYAGGRTMLELVWAAIAMSVVLSLFFVLLRYGGLPRTMGVLQPMTFVGLVGTARLLLRFLLVDFAPRAPNVVERNVAIYGAGRAGQQLSLSIRHESHFRVVGYLDDDWRLHGQRIDGCPILNPADFQSVAAERRVDEVLIALPSASRERRREIVEAVQPFCNAVRVLPSTAEIIAGEVSLNDLREVQIEDLLGRDPVPPNELLLRRHVAGQVVLVTGAGGSIGSELCRQLIALKPAKLVLMDHSEFALYAILDELSANSEGTLLVPELCNVGDAESVRRIFLKHGPETVFHSAAYKHVPLVEANPVAGASNNIVGTLNCCLAAEGAGVRNFILISTDKAVRPTNVMGASKRVCELILQARAEMTTEVTFAMVRFGNVLGSSGSVIPRFKAQIAAGGPVTVTHRDVTRYFMTIPEAAQLVIQAGAMADGGDVFMLDMGEPVKIIDLARTLIRLSHRSVRDADNPSGEIEIIETGLRDGEKLYEELLIGSNPQPTLHPRIVKAREEKLDWPTLEKELKTFQEFASAGDGEAIVALLHRLVPGFVRVVHRLEGTRQA